MQLIPWYKGTNLSMSCQEYAMLGRTPLADASMAAPKHKDRATLPVERVQTGVRLEKRLLKVLKGLAESLDLSLGDLLEGVALHALENKPPFSAATLKKIADLKRVYGLELTAGDSHRLREKS
jgi:predicted DNA-binding ribbon-helix-helix protein